MTQVNFRASVSDAAACPFVTVAVRTAAVRRVAAVDGDYGRLNRHRTASEGEGYRWRWCPACTGVAMHRGRCR